MRPLAIWRKLAIIPVVAAIGFLSWEASRIPWANLQGYLPASPLGAALALLGLFALKTFVVVIPLYALYITASLLFPPIWAVLICYLGLAIELLAGYWVGRRMGQSQVRTRIEKYEFSNWLLKLIERHPLQSCFIIRFLPLPADISNMLLGASSVRWTVYLLVSLVGLTPKMLPYVLAGEAATNAQTDQFTLMVGILLVLELAPLLIVWFRRKPHP